MTLGYTQPAWRHWIFDGSVRYYRQNAADFYSDIFPRAELLELHGPRPRAGGVPELYRRRRALPTSSRIPHVPWISKSTLNLRFDHLIINYSDYRNALLIDVANKVLPGQEPLYSLDANVLQLFFSIWY